MDQEYTTKFRKQTTFLRVSLKYPQTLIKYI